uniref:Uncharacterized protein n=1 Tax=Rhizophora mucronata TaxID=61149 RepID=A0A2P2PMQ7_RHIMU
MFSVWIILHRTCNNKSGSELETFCLVG